MQASRVWPIEVSDHLPVTAELMWEEPGSNRGIRKWQVGDFVSRTTDIRHLHG